MLISVDAETDGLWGKPFAIGAKAYKEKGDGYSCVADFYACCSTGVKNEWVRENVLPNLENTHASADEVLQEFSKLYLETKDKGYTVLWHMGHVVEAYLFRLLVEKGYIGEWDAPYTPIEVSEHLRQRGFAPDCVDAYVETFQLAKSDGCTHNPLFDCAQAMSVYAHLRGAGVSHNVPGGPVLL